MPGPEQQDMFKQGLERAIRQTLRLHSNAAARLKTEKVQATESGGVLVLLADRLLEHIDFDM